MDFLVTLILGIVVIIIGILNRKGNVSMLHSYHRKRVSEEDIIPFGKIIGLGMFVIGGGLIARSGLYYAASVTNNKMFTVVGTVLSIVGVVVGSGIAFYGMIKYNKGIF